MRTTRQQYLIKQLLHEATSKNLFTQSGQLYQLAKTALQSLNLSEGLADITSLVGLATSMVNLSTDHLYSQTVPITTAPYDPNRVVWRPKPRLYGPDCSRDSRWWINPIQPPKTPRVIPPIPGPWIRRPARFATWKRASSSALLTSISTTSCAPYRNRGSHYLALSNPRPRKKPLPDSKPEIVRTSSALTY